MLRAQKRTLFTMTALGICFLSSPAAVIGAMTGGARDSFGSLGITGAKCSNCSYTINAKSGERFWSFQSEPVITGVDPYGPSGGSLRRGDRIAAIDGMPITTYRAGKRLAIISPGDEVKLHVRRRGRLIERTITAREPESDEESEVEGLGGPLSRVDLQWLASVVSLFEAPGTEPAEILNGLVELSELSSVDLARRNLSERASRPLGWLGMGLSFSGSVVGMFTEDSRWEFYESPEVVSVVRDGPADQAGIQRGDKLTHIGGIRLDSKKGGRRFSAVRPGDRVTWTVERGDRKLDVEMTADRSPEPQG